MTAITEKYCTGNRRYKSAEKFTPVGVVLHSIGTPQPSADVLWRYWQNDSSPYVVHYMVDDQKILHCMPDNFKCWHVGSPGNSKWIGIEMGEPSQIKYTSGAAFTVSDLTKAMDYAEATYKNAVWLIAQLCKKYGWNPNTAIYTHHEVTAKKLSNTDHVDPEHLWNGLGMGYSLLTLRMDVAAAMGHTSSSPAPESPAPGVSTTSGQMYRIRKSWADAASQIGAYSNLEYAKAACRDGYFVFDSQGMKVYPVSASGPYVARVTATALNVRKGPGTSYEVRTVIYKGGAYTIVDEKDGWGKLKSGAGWICLKYTERME